MPANLDTSFTRINAYSVDNKLLAMVVCIVRDWKKKFV